MAKSGEVSHGEAHPIPVATVSIAEAARVIGIGSSTAYRLAEMGRLPVPVLKIGGTWKVLRADLERWAAGGAAQPEAATA